MSEIVTSNIPAPTLACGRGLKSNLFRVVTTRFEVLAKMKCDLKKVKIQSQLSLTGLNS